MDVSVVHGYPYGAVEPVLCTIYFSCLYTDVHGVFRRLLCLGTILLGARWRLSASLYGENVIHIDQAQRQMV